MADPDEVLRHEPTRCGGCGAGLGLAPEVALARRQVSDLPPIAIRVTEHQLTSRQCRCGAVTTAGAPAGVNAPVQYGPRIKAVMVYLCMGQYLSKHRTAVAMSELFNTPGLRRDCFGSHRPRRGGPRRVLRGSENTDRRRRRGTFR